MLCAGAPDTPEIAAETAAAIAELQAQRPGVFWFDGMLTLPEVKQVLSASTVFVCPSVYEPLGIVNLEAMACGAAVVASDVGGIPEVVNNGETGTAGALRRGRRPTGSSGPSPAAVNDLVRDPAKAAAFGAAGRERDDRRVLLDGDRRADGRAVPVGAGLIAAERRRARRQVTEPPGCRSAGRIGTRAGTVCSTVVIWDDDRLQRVTQCGSFVGGDLHHQSSTAFQRNTHDDPAALLGHFERTIPGAGLHGRHVRLPPELT